MSNKDRILKIVISVAIFSTLIILLYQCKVNKRLNNEKVILETNLKAHSSEIKYYKDVNGKLYAEKETYIGEIDNIKELNSDLYNEVNFFKKQTNSDPIMFSRFNTKIEHDTVYLLSNVTEYDSSNILIDFKYDSIYNKDTRLVIDGDLIYNKVNKNVRNFKFNNIDLKYKNNVSLSKDKNKLTVIVTNTIPFSITDSINSIVLDETLHPKIKKSNSKKYVIGIQLGVRLSKDIKPIPYIGIGITRKIISF